MLLCAQGPTYTSLARTEALSHSRELESPSSWLKYVPLCAAGIGKSTLLNLIGGTLEPTVGHITRNAKVPPQLQPASAPACGRRCDFQQDVAVSQPQPATISLGLLRRGFCQCADSHPPDINPTCALLFDRSAP